jgi:hypothetical protein
MTDDLRSLSYADMTPDTHYRLTVGGGSITIMRPPDNGSYPPALMIVATQFRDLVPGLMFDIEDLVFTADELMDLKWTSAHAVDIHDRQRMEICQRLEWIDEIRRPRGINTREPVWRRYSAIARGEEPMPLAS